MSICPPILYVSLSIFFALLPSLFFSSSLVLFSLHFLWQALQAHGVPSLLRLALLTPPCALTHSYNDLGPAGGTSVAAALTALTGLTRLNFG